MAQDINSDASQSTSQETNNITPEPPLTGVTPPEITQPQVIAPSPQPTPVPPAPVAPAPQQPPITQPVTVQPPAQPIQPVQATAPSPTKPGFIKKLLSHKKVLGILLLVLLLAAVATGAFLFGKSHERIIIQAPDPLPINLPPQAVIVNECKAGRGKQYILPKDIPIGPVYDVVNNKVIGVEYNFKASDLFVNADKLSDTLIPFFKGNYKTENFTVTPGTLQPGQQQADTPINVAIFVVNKDEVNKITCGGASS